MGKNRLEAFSEGVLAIIITIMVLELKVPPRLFEQLPHTAELADLKPLLPVFLSYVLSFVYLGIYWNNHHHMFHTTKHVTGGILWSEPASAVLALAVSVHDGLDGRKPSRADAHRRLWLRAADGGHRVLNFATQNHRLARCELPARCGDRQGLEGKTLACALSCRHSARVRERLDFQHVVYPRRIPVARS